MTRTKLGGSGVPRHPNWMTKEQPGGRIGSCLRRDCASLTEPTRCNATPSPNESSACRESLAPVHRYRGAVDGQACSATV
jgi:hypothetical protein